jgi:hypothetical protein
MFYKVILFANAAVCYKQHMTAARACGEGDKNADGEASGMSVEQQ